MIAAPATMHTNPGFILPPASLHVFNAHSVMSCGRLGILHVEDARKVKGCQRQGALVGQTAQCPHQVDLAREAALGQHAAQLATGRAHGDAALGHNGLQ